MLLVWAKAERAAGYGTRSLIALELSYSSLNQYFCCTFYVYNYAHYLSVYITKHVRGVRGPLVARHVL